MNVKQTRRTAEAFAPEITHRSTPGQAGQGHAELCRGKICIQMRADVFDKVCASVSLLHQLIELAGRGLLRSQIRTRRKIRSGQRAPRWRQLAENDAARIPVVR